MSHVEVIVPGKASASAVVAGAKTASVFIVGKPAYPAVTSGDISAQIIVPGASSADAQIAGIAGPQGVAGSDGAPGADGSISGAVGLEGAIQYKSGIFLQGAKAFFYEKANDILRFSGEQLIVEDGTFKVSGKNKEAEHFVSIKNDDDQILRVDTKNKKVLFTSNVGNEYKIGIGTDSPQERVHIDGNLKVDGTGFFTEGLYISGHPVATGAGTTVDLLARSGVADLTGVTGALSSATGFLDDKTDFLFLRTPIATGTPYFGSRQAISWSLNYAPKVVNSLVSPNLTNSTLWPHYAMNTVDISNTGCWVFFSSDVKIDGFYLESFVSSEHWKS